MAALWRPIEGWARWWMLGEEGGTAGGNSSSGLGGVASAAAAARVDGGDGGGCAGALAPWRRSWRLLALYWTIAITKAAAAYILM